ncbi:MAG: exodeoxyribonuclease VII small subunit [Gammaproteobacteria bacterium]
MARKNTSNTVDFEKSLKQLETLVDKLEKGDLTLEESLRNFEQGVKLTRDCRQALKTVEQKISILSKEDKDWIEKDLDEDEATNN